MLARRSGFCSRYRTIRRLPVARWWTATFFGALASRTVGLVGVGGVDYRRLLQVRAEDIPDLAEDGGLVVEAPQALLGQFVSRLG